MATTTGQGLRGKIQRYASDGKALHDELRAHARAMQDPKAALKLTSAIDEHSRALAAFESSTLAVVSGTEGGDHGG